MSGSSHTSAAAPPGALAGATSIASPPPSKRDRRRESFDALGRAVLNTQQHQLQQQQQHQQQHLFANPTALPPPHGLATPSRSYSPSLSPAPAPTGMPSLPGSPSRVGLNRHPNTYSHPMASSAHGQPYSMQPMQPTPGPSHMHQPPPAHPPQHVELPAAEFPFPSLLTLNRSRLLHLLEYQCRLSSAPDSHNTPHDPDSLAHYRTLMTSINSLNLHGGVYKFSFAHGSSIVGELLGELQNATSSTRGKAYNSRLTAIHLVEILQAIRKAPSPNLAHPSELPPALLDAGIFYRPDQDQPTAMQLSPFVYHRVLALLSFLMNLHIHQLTLARILQLLHGIDEHLDYWTSHQALTSLPKPYRLWKFLQFTFWPASSSASSSSSGLQSGGTSATSSGMQSPRRGALSSPSPAYSSVPLKDAGASSSTNPYHKWQKTAARNVRELVDLKKRWTTRAGRIAVRMHTIQEWMAASFGKTAAPSRGAPSTAAPAIQFHQQIDLNSVYFAKIFRYVVREDLPAGRPATSATNNHAHPTASGLDGSIQEKIYALYTQFGSYEQFLVSFETRFTPYFEGEIAKRRKPHHLFEWWHWYTGVGLVLGAAGYYALRNQKEVVDTVGTTWKSMHFFLHEHLQEPLANIYEESFKTFQDRSLFTTNEKTLRQSRDNLSSMLSEFALAHAAELAKHEAMQQQEYTRQIDQRAKAMDMDLVMKPYNREIQHPIRSLLVGNLFKGLLIQIQKVKVDTEAAMLAMDQILRSNAINFNLLSTIPFLLFTYGLIDFSTRYVLKTTWNSKDVVAKVRESKRLLSDLEQIFILHLPPLLYAHDHRHSNVDPASSPSGRRPASHAQQLHAAVHTLSIDEFAALGSQEQEDEDESLRMQSPVTRDASHMGTEIFGILDQATDGVEPVSDDEDEENGDADVGQYEANATAAAASSPSGRHGFARNLFPSAAAHSSSSSSHPDRVVARRPSSSVLGLNNHAYGHTLLLIHELSMRLSSLPLHASMFSTRLTGSDGMQDARLTLHKDLILLSSDALSPDQKLRWLKHMREAYAFLAQ